ncbi:MAG TPA: hypothetical protein GX715_09235 [Armatimonadetes bacterium]|jgi:hypothetical protein|nr:hypothetical protein [Armatimonadota bacterium]
MIITKRVTMDARVRLAHASALQVALVTLFMLFTAGAGAQETWETRRAKLGSKEEPYRILVDKVLMASNEWVMTPEHVAEIKAAGFNVVVPRTGADENERVERVARMAMEQGLFYMPWIRGTRVETGDPKLRATDELGRTGSLASPNADALWDYWRDRILFYARLSREVPSVLGVFLDFENYDRVKIGGGMCYTLSYDEPILRQFAQARGLSLPDPLPANRAEWLEKQGQTKAFEEFQVGRWRERARKLRQEVDALNPRFQFVVYPATHSLFIREAVWREWHTKQAPLIMAEVDTYWRHEYDLAATLERLREIMINAREALDKVDPTIRYMAGLDPIVPGANPEFEGKSAVLGAEFGHGYWVFYEGPDYHKDHRDHFRWFKRANDCIARGDYSLWRQPAETPNPFDAAVADEARGVAGAKLVPFNTDPVPQEALEHAFIHRTAATYQVLLKQGERLRGELVALQLAHIRHPSVMAVVSPSGKLLTTLRAEIGKPVSIDLVAPEEGVYGIAVSSGRGRGQLKLTNRYASLIGSKLWLVHDQPAAYFAPEAGVERFAFSIHSDAPAEHVRVTFRSPDGTVLVDRDTREEPKVQVRGEVKATRGAWKLDLANAVEDIHIEFGEGCQPRLATHPGRLLVTAR